MRTMLTVLVLVLAGSTPVEAMDSSSCFQAVQVDRALGLSQYTDSQVKNGLCLFSKAYMMAITEDNDLAKSACAKAFKAMFIEFKKRFPNENPSSCP